MWRQKCSVCPFVSESSTTPSGCCTHRQPLSSCVVFQLAAAAVPSVYGQMQVTVCWDETHPLSKRHRWGWGYWMIHGINGVRQYSSDFVASGVCGLLEVYVADMETCTWHCGLQASNTLHYSIKVKIGFTAFVARCFYKCFIFKKRITPLKGESPFVTLNNLGSMFLKRAKLVIVLYALL